MLISVNIVSLKGKSVMRREIEFPSKGAKCRGWLDVPDNSVANQPARNRDGPRVLRSKGDVPLIHVCGAFRESRIHCWLPSDSQYRTHIAYPPAHDIRRARLPYTC